MKKETENTDEMEIKRMLDSMKNKHKDKKEKEITMKSEDMLNEMLRQDREMDEATTYEDVPFAEDDSVGQSVGRAPTLEEVMELDKQIAGEWKRDTARKTKPAVTKAASTIQLAQTNWQTQGKVRAKAVVPDVVWASEEENARVIAESNICGGLFLKGTVVMFAGQPGCGKSTFLYNMGINVSQGKEFMPFVMGGRKIPQRAIKVMYFDGDQAPWDRAYIINNVKGNAQLRNFATVSKVDDYAKDFDIFYDTIDAYKPELVILDTQSAWFSSIDENSSQHANVQMSNLLNTAAEFNNCIVVVHHLRKQSSENPNPSLRGHSSREGRAHGVLFLITEENAGGSQTYLQVHKHRNAARGERYYVDTDFEKKIMSVRANATPEELHGQVREMVEMRGNTASYSEFVKICERLGMSNGVARGYLAKLMREKKIEKDADKQYHYVTQMSLIK
jgi:RecA-family ATPase